MSNWTMVKEFLGNAAVPQQGDAVVRVNVFVKHDGTKKYSVESGSIGGDFPIRISRYTEPRWLAAMITLMTMAKEWVEAQEEQDALQLEAEKLTQDRIKREDEAKKKFKQQRRENNLAVRKAENQARAHGGTKKKG